jgi:iron-sulfur cluster repair protein YtfE (RIC family)
MMPAPERAQAASSFPGDMRVVDLVMQVPQVAEVLARHGIVFCPGCYVALTSSVVKAAQYNAVQDVAGFLAELAEAVRRAQAAGGT